MKARISCGIAVLAVLLVAGSASAATVSTAKLVSAKICKPTPALLAAVLPDIYCCAESDQEARFECLTGNYAYINRLNAFFEKKILLTLPPAIGEDAERESAAQRSLQCRSIEAIDIEPTAPVAERIGVGITRIDCGVLSFTSQYELIRNRIEKNCD